MDNFRIQSKGFGKAMMIAVMVFVILAVLVLSSKRNINNVDLEAIKRSYLDAMLKTGYPSDMTTDDVFIDEYCGTYKGSVVVMISDSQTLFTTAIHTETVAGVKILYSDGNRLAVWKDDSFYTLEEAFENGFLTRGNIILIKYIHLLN